MVCGGAAFTIFVVRPYCGTPGRFYVGIGKVSFCAFEIAYGFHRLELPCNGPQWELQGCWRNGIAIKLLDIDRDPQLKESSCPVC